MEKMRQVDWQAAGKLKGGRIRHAIHSGSQVKSPTGRVPLIPQENVQLQKRYVDLLQKWEELFDLFQFMTFVANHSERNTGTTADMVSNPAITDVGINKLMPDGTLEVKMDVCLG